MTGDSDPAGLGRMFELAVATALSNLIPTVVVNEAQNISRLQLPAPLSLPIQVIFLQLLTAFMARERDEQCLE